MATVDIIKISMQQSSDTEPLPYEVTPTECQKIIASMHNPVGHPVVVLHGEHGTSYFATHAINYLYIPQVLEDSEQIGTQE